MAPELVNLWVAGCHGVWEEVGREVRAREVGGKLLKATVRKKNYVNEEDRQPEPTEQSKMHLDLHAANKTLDIVKPFRTFTPSADCPAIVEEDKEKTCEVLSKNDRINNEFVKQVRSNIKEDINEAKVTEANAATEEVNQDTFVKRIMKTRAVQCTRCKAQFATLQGRRLHTCNSVMHTKINTEGNSVRRRQEANQIHPSSYMKHMEEEVANAHIIKNPEASRTSQSEVLIMKKDGRNCLKLADLPEGFKIVVKKTEKSKWKEYIGPDQKRFPSLKEIKSFYETKEHEKIKSVKKISVVNNLKQSSRSSNANEQNKLKKVVNNNKSEKEAKSIISVVCTSRLGHQERVTYRVPATCPMHRVVKKVAAKMGVGQEQLLLLVGEQEVVGEQLARDFNKGRLAAKTKEMTLVDIRQFPVLPKIEPTIDSKFSCRTVLPVFVREYGLERRITIMLDISLWRIEKKFWKFTCNYKVLIV